MIEFVEAKRENVNLLISLAGPSGCGKTKSALRLAQGISPGGKIAFIDTESRRGLHYASDFKFTHWDMRPPFPPSRFIEGIKAAESSGADILVIDSFSHEYAGDGGIMDMASAAERGGTKPPGNWLVPKAEHKKLVNAILQARLSIIFCLRADEKIRIEKHPDTGKTLIVPMGWTPIAEKRFIYEMTVSITMTDVHPGRPDYRLPHKIQEQHLPMFPEGELIGEDAGRRLAAWARGDTIALRGPEPDVIAKAAADLAAAATSASMDLLREVWGKLGGAVQKAVGGEARLKELKAQVEKNAAEESQ
jgi:AAA domain-containing protein